MLSPPCIRRPGPGLRGPLHSLLFSRDSGGVEGGIETDGIVRQTVHPRRFFFVDGGRFGIPVGVKPTATFQSGSCSKIPAAKGGGEGQPGWPNRPLVGFAGQPPPSSDSALKEKYLFSPIFSLGSQYYSAPWTPKKATGVVLTKMLCVTFLLSLKTWSLASPPSKNYFSFCPDSQCPLLVACFGFFLLAKISSPQINALLHFLFSTPPPPPNTYALQYSHRGMKANGELCESLRKCCFPSLYGAAQISGRPRHGPDNIRVKEHPETRSTS